MITKSVFSQCQQCQQCLQPFLSAHSQRGALHRTHKKLHASRKEQSQTHRGGPLPATVQHTQNNDNASPLKGVQSKIDSTPARVRQPDLAKQLLVVVALTPASFLLQDASALALTIHQEPENALSFPTWVIHISSVIEWAIAMALVWKYAEVTGAMDQQAGKADFPAFANILTFCTCGRPCNY